MQANVVSQETSDANVVSKVALGQVDAGFVYLSDYVIDPTHLTLITVPAWAQPKITYSMCIDDQEPEPGRRAGLAWTRPEPGGPGDLRQGRLPAADGAGADDREGLAGEDAAGTTVTLTGTNLKGTTSVTFQGVPAKFKVVSTSKLTVTVPAKAKTGSLTVTNPSGTATWKCITIAPDPIRAAIEQERPTPAPPRGEQHASRACCPPRGDLGVERAGRCLFEHPVDEEDDRARRLEPEADEHLLGADAAREPRLERGDRRHGHRALRFEQRPCSRPGPLEQDELEQEQRADVADMVDRLGEPAGELLAARRRSPGRARGSARARRARCRPASISPRASSSSSAR